jgi:glucose-1-phosphate thymidylyltransferase
LFERLLGSGEDLGMRFAFAEQAVPGGLAEALLIGEAFLAGQPCALVLGDNLFYGAGLSALLKQSVKTLDGCTLFAYRVDDPQRYGVVELGPDGSVLSLEEKPARPRSPLAVTGLYLYDGNASTFAKTLRPSARGELEITDLNRIYVERGKARVQVLGRGVAWLDTGTPQSLLEAAQFVHALQSRQGMQIACLEEVAYRERFIDAEQLARVSALHGNSVYGSYLSSIVKGD